MAEYQHGDTAWYTSARFGMFIHWGLYSLPARHEWMRWYERLEEAQYQIYFDCFNPDLFDPKGWAKAAKQAGMKYFVVTTKHHEGFCLWDSQYTDYKVTNTPFGRDALREIVDAFRAEGLRIGLYYSLIDWHHPDFTIDGQHPQRDVADREERNRTRDMAKYREYMKNQLTELLTNYGKIDLIFFDFSYPNHPKGGKGHLDWDSEGIVKLVRRLQPQILVNERLDLPGSADIDTSVEQFLAEKPLLDADGNPVVWEACHTFSGSWGYFRDQFGWKNTEMCIKLLIQHIAINGNLILNVGPTSRGRLDKRALDRLKGIGDWMEFNSRAIYGCTRAPEAFPAPADCRYTWNPETNRLYLCFMSWPFQYVHLPNLGCGRVQYAQLLWDGSEIKRRESKEAQNGSTPDGALTLDLPTVLPEGCIVPVIELFLNK